MKKLLFLLLCLPIIILGQESDCGKEPKKPNSFNQQQYQLKLKEYKKKLKKWEECRLQSGVKILPKNCNFIQSGKDKFDNSITYDMKDQIIYQKIGIPILYNSSYAYLRFYYEDGLHFIRIRSKSPKNGCIERGDLLNIILENNERLDLKCAKTYECDHKEQIVGNAYGVYTYHSYETKGYYPLTIEELEMLSKYKISALRIGFNSYNIDIDNFKHYSKIQKSATCMFVATEGLEHKNFPKIKDVNNSKRGDWQGNGTGFFISRSGHIVTNNHVIDDASDIAVEFKYKNEIKEFNAKVIKVDEANDLAIIKIEDSQFSNISVIPYSFKTRSADVGTEVFALGYPMALSIMGKDIKFTDGKISSKTGFNGDITTYQIQVPIQPGNSGGPLFDTKGNLIGITSSGVSRKLDLTENVNYAIKSSYLLNLIDVLPETITLPSNNQLASKKLTEQIKVLSDYVVLIKVR